MSAWEIVPCGPGHGETVARLHGLCFDDPWTAAAVKEVLAMPGAFGLLARRGEDPAGFVLCRAAADECEVLALGVLSEHRGAGLGSRLLAAAREVVAASGVRRLFLEVAEDNAAARAFYGAHGFREAGRRKGYYRRLGVRPVDALILSGGI